MRIAHVITGLTMGGAEMMLLKVVRATAGTIAHDVISLAAPGPVGHLLEQAGAKVSSLNIGRSRISPRAAIRLASELRRIRPDLVQGWMYHGNLAALIGARLSGLGRPVAWTIRTALNDIKNERKLTRVVIRLCARLSGSVSLIIYNSERAYQEHRDIGYASARSVTLVNGFDTEQFKPSETLRTAVRGSLGLGEDAIVVGSVGRNHSVKDYPTLLSAVEPLCREFENLRIVLAGRDLDKIGADEKCAMLVRALGDRLVLLPEQSDVATLMRAFDIFAFSSAWGESFPNVLGEAMSSGVPCVSTDVGGAAAILGGVGPVVKVRDAACLSTAIRELIVAGNGVRRFRGEAGRRRVQDHFSLGAMANAYEAEWKRAVSGRLSEAS